MTIPQDVLEAMAEAAHDAVDLDVRWPTLMKAVLLAADELGFVLVPKTPTDEMIESAARAWLKLEYYDPEPEQYKSLEDFWAREQWWTMAGMFDARWNAKAALEASLLAAPSFTEDQN